MKVGDKLRKIPMTTDGKVAIGTKKGKLQKYTIKQILGHMIVAEHENGYLEAFTKSDAVAPLDYKIDVKENGEWRYLRESDFY